MAQAQVWSPFCAGPPNLHRGYGDKEPPKGVADAEWWASDEWDPVSKAGVGVKAASAGVGSVHVWAYRYYSALPHSSLVYQAKSTGPGYIEFGIEYIGSSYAVGTGLAELRTLLMFNDKVYLKPVESQASLFIPGMGWDDVLQTAFEALLTLLKQLADQGKARFHRMGVVVQFKKGEYYFIKPGLDAIITAAAGGAGVKAVGRIKYIVIRENKKNELYNPK